MNFNRLSFPLVSYSRLLIRRSQSTSSTSAGLSLTLRQKLTATSSKLDHVLRKAGNFFGQGSPPLITSRSQISSARRIVVKVGSSIVTRENNYGLALVRMASLVEQVAALQTSGRKIVIVSSGAVACGQQELGQKLVMSMSTRPGEVKSNTASLNPRMIAIAAAVGQNRMMSLYEAMFAHYGVKIGQVLVTKDAFTNDYSRKNLYQTMSELLALNVVPIVNTNDAISECATNDAIDGDLAFAASDNDSLAAILAKEVHAELMVMMSLQDGLFTGPPDLEGSTLLRSYYPDLMQGEVQYGEKLTPGCTGMESKVVAATWALNNGIATVICNGSREGTLNAVIEGKEIGTLITTPAQDLKSQQSIPE